MGIEERIYILGKGRKLHIDEIAYKDLQEDKRLLSFGVIVESGSNSNGFYIRWGDGTQYCYHTIDSADAAPYTYTEQGIVIKGWKYEWNFPKPFRSGSDYVVSGSALLTGTGNRNMSISLDSGLSYSSAPLRFETMIQAGSGFIGKVAVIGRWK